MKNLFPLSLLCFFLLHLPLCSSSQTKEKNDSLFGTKEDEKIKVMVETDTTINSSVSKTYNGKIIGTLIGAVGGYVVAGYIAAHQSRGFLSPSPGCVAIGEGIAFGVIGYTKGWIIDSKQNKQPFLIFRGTNNGKFQAITIRETRTVFYTFKNDSLVHKGKLQIKDKEHFTLKGQKNISIGINNLDKINRKSTLYRNIFVPLFLAIVPVSVFALTKNNKDGFRVDYSTIIMSSPYVGIAIGYGIGNYFDRQRTLKNMLRVAFIKNN